MRGFIKWLTVDLPKIILSTAVLFLMLSGLAVWLSAICELAVGV